MHCLPCREIAEFRGGRVTVKVSLATATLLTLLHDTRSELARALINKLRDVTPGHQRVAGFTLEVSFRWRWLPARTSLIRLAHAEFAWHDSLVSAFTASCVLQSMRRSAVARHRWVDSPRVQFLPSCGVAPGSRQAQAAAQQAQHVRAGPLVTPFMHVLSRQHLDSLTATLRCAAWRQ